MAQNPKKYLNEWIIRFIKNKDLVLKRIVDIKETDEGILVTEKEKKVLMIVEKDLSNFKKSLEKLKEYDFCSLVVYNTKDNFDILIKNWDELSSFKRHFSIYFVNPFSTLEKRWVIFPYTHNMLTEKENLKLSLKSIAELVDQIDDKKLEKLTI